MEHGPVSECAIGEVVFLEGGHEVVGRLVGLLSPTDCSLDWTIQPSVMNHFVSEIGQELSRLGADCSDDGQF